MKNMVWLFFLFTTLHVCAQHDNESGKAPVISMDALFKAKAKESVGKSFPGFTAVFNKRIITKDSLKGKVVFINFWFEACPPCMAELSALNELYKRFPANEQVEFISFTFDKPSDIARLKKKFKIEYPVASVSRQECYRLNQNNGFPTSIILDEAGTIRYLFTGGDTDKKKARDFVLHTIYESIREEQKNQ